MKTLTPLITSLLFTTSLSFSGLTSAGSLTMGPGAGSDFPIEIEGPIHPVFPEWHHPVGLTIDRCFDIGYGRNWRIDDEYEIGSVVYEDVGLGFGTSGETTMIHLKEDGLYKISLTDFEFPDPFETLSLAVTSATEIYAHLVEAGEAMFSALAGNLYFTSYYESSTPIPGLFGFELTYMGDYTSPPTAVPAPGAAWLMISGLAGLGALKRRKSS